MNLIKIGSHLKSIREKNNISLEEVYNETRIQISILEDIEGGQSSLSPAFLKGFIRTYAKFLKADVEPHLRESKKPQKPVPVKKDSKKPIVVPLVLFFVVCWLLKDLMFKKDTPNPSNPIVKDDTDLKVEPPSLLSTIKTGGFKQDILIQSLKPLEIYFKVDNHKLQTKNLTPKIWYNIKALDKIYLRFDKTQEVNLFHNGKQMVVDRQSFEKNFTDTM